MRASTPLRFRRIRSSDSLPCRCNNSNHSSRTLSTVPSAVKPKWPLHREATKRTPSERKCVRDRHNFRPSLFMGSWAPTKDRAEVALNGQPLSRCLWWDCPRASETCRALTLRGRRRQVDTTDLRWFTLTQADRATPCSTPQPPAQVVLRLARLPSSSRTMMPC